MAEQARQQEDDQASLQSCLDKAGWVDKTVLPDGGVEEPFTVDEYDRFLVDLGKCRVEMGYPAEPSTTLSPELLRTIYSRQLDVARCLEHEGHEVSEPPTEDAYVESAGDPESPNNWSPYDAISSSAITEPEFNELYKKCPEPWLPPQ
ncbi:hypothetical protein [Oerskovia sp. KBS0722]|uniref:hypothetical protein n=1 Tax=Oerskovia sp. KBS0722 TaxID=1179673 RepID=UPI00110D3EAC|nr:hypothetical protein [Oerskovia sp. KBS0722]QDW61379.1 hypothetical protein FFI11_001565 [Oerskovia sp. KBS0722]